MNGYPKHVATKRDYVNLFENPEFRSRALTELEQIRDLDDDMASRVVMRDDSGDEIVESVPNPQPLWRVKGFESRQEIANLIAAYQEVSS